MAVINEEKNLVTVLISIGVFVFIVIVVISLFLKSALFKKDSLPASSRKGAGDGNIPGKSKTTTERYNEYIQQMFKKARSKTEEAPGASEYEGTERNTSLPKAEEAGSNEDEQYKRVIERAHEQYRVFMDLEQKKKPLINSQ